MTIWSLVQRPPRPERRGAAVAGRAVSCVPALSCSPTRSDTCCTASPRISRRTCSNCPAREQLCPTRCGRFVVADAVGGLDARRRMTCCGWIETPSRGSVWLMVATRRTDLKFGLLTPVSYYGIIAQSKHGQSTGPALPAHPSYSGGRRPGAGRKRMPGRRASVPHRQRPPHVAAHPVHVTLRSVEAVRCLRAARVFPLVRGALVASSRADFDEFSEASQGRDRDRSVLVCRMVRRVARATRRERHRAAARGLGTDLARARRLATARADSIGGAAEVVR